VLIAKFLNYFDKTKYQIQDNNKNVNVITVSQHSFTIHLTVDLLVRPFFSEESFSGTHLYIRYDIIYTC